MIDYFKNVFKLYDYVDLIIESIFISILIILIDTFEILSLALYKKFLFAIILIFICYLINYINKNNFKKITLPNINELDKYNIELGVSFFIILFFTIILNYKLYKMILLLFVFIIFLIILLFRIKSNSKSKSESKNNILDLESVCNNIIDLKQYNGLAMFDESDVEYDLLNRTLLIDELYNVVHKTIPSKSFTIGLNGKWGSGKTTVINNVLKHFKDNEELSNYVIITFDPWQYNDEKQMIESFINDILKKINYNIAFYRKNEIVKDVISTLFDKECKGIIDYIFDEINNNSKIPNISNVVNNYLVKNNKKMLIIMDNLDRIDGEKALFLIKCLDTVFNFDKTINVLLYDEEIINNALRQKFNFNSNYMDKLVQLKIEMPLIDKSTIQEIKNKISNNLLYDNKKIIDYLSNESYDFNNIRELKRFLNLIISKSLYVKNYTENDENDLNRNDYSILKYIQFRCPQLYYEIWNNKYFYIMYDRKYSSELYTFDYENLNKDAKNYFSQLYNNEAFKDYLSYAEKLFPNMSNYKSNGEVFPKTVEHSKYVESILKNRIHNFRYFDLYFTGEKNIFVKIKKDVDEVINKINESNDYFNLLLNISREYGAEELKVFMEIFDLSFKNIKCNDWLSLFYNLIEIIPYTNKRLIFGELDSEQRLYVIISKLLANISKQEFNSIKNKFQNNFKQLFMIYNIKYWIDSNKKEKKYDYCFDFDNLYNEMCNSILKNEIDIYDSKYYTRGNIWALFHFSNKKTQKFISKIIDKNNIYLILNDMISTSYGSGEYGYRISDESIYALLPNIDIKSYLTRRKLNNKELFAKNVYLKSIKEKDSFKKGIYTRDYIDL